MQPDLRWQKCGEFADIVYEKADGIARVTINRPSRRNAFTPDTVAELLKAFGDARDDATIGVVLLRGANPQHDGKFAFCAGGDQKIRGDKKGGYVGKDGVPRLNVLDLQRLIRSMPKVVIALVAGYAIGGGHVLHVICDLTIAADNAVFGQKKAREIWYFCRQYDAKQALEMGLVNTVVPYEQLDAEGVQWAREILTKSPLAIRCLKSAFNAELDGQAGIQELSGNATLLYYLSEEGDEGRAAWNEKRAPNFRKFPWLP